MVPEWVHLMHLLIGYGDRLCAEWQAHVNAGFLPPPSAADDIDMGLPLQPLLATVEPTAYFVPVFTAAPFVRAF